MNVLFVIHTNGNEDECTLALVPLEKVGNLPLDKIDGKMLNLSEMTPEEMDAIVKLYERFGLDKEGRPGIEADLKECLSPQVPFQSDKVVHIGWLG